MNLPERDSYIVSGGHEQSRIRALFIGLLPKEGMWTAAEVVRLNLPRKEDTEYRKEHADPLRSISNKNGLREGGDPGPDNVGPDGKLLPGKRPRNRQRCRWVRDNWLSIISDPVYEWLNHLNEEIAKMVVESPPGSRIWCDLDDFELVAEEPEPEQLLTDDTLADALTGEDDILSDALSSPDFEDDAHDEEEENPEIEEIAEQAPRRRRIWVPAASMVAAIVLAFMLWPRPRQDISQAAHDEIEPTQAEIANYIKANMHEELLFQSPRPGKGEWLASWQSDDTHPHMIAEASPPPTLQAGEYDF
jgi:hypothetical protein